MQGKQTSEKLPYSPFQALYLQLAVILVTCILLGFFAEPAFAVEADGNTGIVIEADITEYKFESEGMVVTAEGNAKVTYNDFFISADYIYIYTGPGNLLACGDVTAYLESRSITCEQFSYNLYTGEGCILEPDAYISNVHLKGAGMDVSPGILTLDNAYVTGCGLGKPCYRVTSKKIIIYPDDRIVLEWPTFRLGDIPVMISPVLILPLKGDRIGFGEDGAKGIPIPRISYDSSGGLLMGFTYYDQPKSGIRLSYEGAYSLKHKGIKASVEAKLSLGKEKTGTLGCTYASWEGFSGKAGYMMSLSDFATLNAILNYIPEKTETGSGSWKGFETGDFEARLVMQTKGDIPFQVKAMLAKDLPSTGKLYRVPELGVSLKPISIPGGIGTLALSGGYGRYEEPSYFTKASKTHIAAYYTSPTLSLPAEMTGNVSLHLKKAWYETGDTLNSVTMKAGVKRNFGGIDAFGKILPRVKAGISYGYVYVLGESPFRFDKISPSNEITVSMDWRVNKSWSVGISASYDFDKKGIDDVDALLIYHNHCYDIRATWNQKDKISGIDIKFTR
ncbi:MAG: DUF3769 domain-containing protein [Firmicutes bacterium]|nr:DUF3769 domain-containing protein [Bacillota bacterium]